MLMRRPVVWLIRFVVLVAASVVATPGAHAQPGDIDPTFQYPRPGLFAPDAYNAVPVPGGWLTVKVTLPRSPVEQTTLTLTQIDRDGRVVTGFGDGGIVVQKLPGQVDASAVVRRLPDGKILLAGFMAGPDGRRLSAVVRLDMSGRIDPAFAGSGGVFAFDVPGDGDQIGALDVLPDGRIVAVVYSRIDPFDYFDCVRDRVTLVTMPNAPGGGPVELVQARDRDTFGTAACRESISLQVGQDGRVLFGSEVGVFRADAGSTEPSIVTGPANGPFAIDEKYELVYSIVDGDGFAVQTTSNPSSGPVHMYRGLGQAAGVPFWSTWNRMAVDAARDVVYAGFAAGEGHVAVARFELPSGELDTGWGGGDGIVTLPRVPGSAPYYFYGYSIGTEVRLIDVQPDGAIVVATADGVVTRILGGQDEQHGALSLVGATGPIERTRQQLQIQVQRLAGASGAVSVDYSVASPTCTDSFPGDCIGGFKAASPGEDFVGASGTLEWPDGDVTDRVIEVEILPGPSQWQLQEYFSVKLMNPTGGAGMIVANTNIYLAGATQPPPSPPAPDPSNSPGSGSSGGGGTSWATLLLLGGLAARCRRSRLTAR
jgi:MYXO-CTERM domain-containing protein